MEYFQKRVWNDKWIAEEVFKGRGGGYFVEVGSAKGKWGSSCYALEKELGWKGIAIDARDHLKYLAEFRPNSIAVNACLWSKEGEEVDFVEYDESTVGGLSGIINQDPFMRRPDKESHHAKNPKAIKSTKQIIKKKTTTLGRVLSDNKAPNIIDYLSMDIERSEAAVLSTFPFDEYKFKAISIEGAHAHEYLVSNGYVQVINPFCEVKWEFYYIHEDFLIKQKYKV